MRPWQALAKTSVAWLGLSTLGALLLFGTELLLRAPEALSPRTVAYLALLSLLVTVHGTAVVATAHALPRLFERFRARAALAVWLVFAVLVTPLVMRVAADLTAGDWISHQPRVGLWRVLLTVALVLACQLLWLWHAYGSSSALRAWLRKRLGGAQRLAIMADALFALTGFGVLAAVFVALPGVLRPYAEIASKLLFPCWLICATLAFSLYRAYPRAALGLAAGVLCACVVPVWMHLSAPVTLGRGPALGAQGLTVFADTLLHPPDPTLVRLDFSHVPDTKTLTCPKPRQEAALPLSDGQRRNVILLSIDAMRSDALGKRFGKRVVAPNMEAFERESMSFTRATAPLAITLLSLSSALTGLSVNQLLWQRSLPTTVFRATRQLLPAQAIFLPSWNIFKGTSFTKMLTRGVKTHTGDRLEDKAALFIAAMETARKKNQRGLFWLHLGDPHLPYTKHKAFNFGPSQLARYYGEVAYDDATIGRILAYLRKSGRFEDSLVVLFADHGELLGERDGYYGHGTRLVGRFTDVPLILHYPGVTPARSDAPVILTQIAPSVLHYLNQPTPEGVAACSLLSSAPTSPHCLPPISVLYGVPTETFSRVIARPIRTIEDAERRQDELIAWRRFTPSLAAISSERRYVRDLKTGVEHLYRRPDPSNDTEDLAASEPAVVDAFRASVAAFRRDEAVRIACQIR